MSECFSLDSLSAKTFSVPGMCAADSHIPWLAHQTHSSGAPNENIVQNRLNVALLNVFWYLYDRYSHIFIP